MMRLAKEIFKAWLIEPQHQRVGLEEAKQIVAAGGHWLDVRPPSEFKT
ncbi:MAG TPA: hypothetical protein VNI53_01630 [Gammaproteobacteria bacterium]|nr:hypothetical protein [Gammaproteobacteria bacterium]